LKKDAATTLIAAIEMIQKGKSFISPSIVSHLSQINIKGSLGTHEQGKFQSGNRL